MRLIGVGMGPGDPELVTVKAVRVLSEADRVFVPVLDGTDTGRAEATVRAHAGHDRIERLVFALNERTDAARRERHWDAAGARIVEWLRAAGGTAAFATIGDPNVYSTFTYLSQTVHALLPEAVIETVPGVTAMQALAAAANVPLSEGTEPLTLLPLARGGVAPLREALANDGSVVVYKAGRHLSEVAEAVKEAGREAVLGTHLGLPDERVDRLSDVDGAAPYLSTVFVPAVRTSRGGKI
ncbi:precorrin-2 C(20)-methyltransferase [Virgisporangium aliadipatigenens]|uniref:Precorrin-2 C(20)-methyltransferase n=1 Tax=Virgisporangium aliadipatigenens TaxID=741659 RepID=A0A8J3YPF4_9ACTN|nr:precorrin-2 C(20)-methyltransferase [Virgisporangium aliadipatigenens]GIJ47610.1 precorrin-2 C(20)-methyltransferase [Virgisporangium aliadipatigenens]